MKSYASLATSHDESRFSVDLDSACETLFEVFDGKRVLVIGGAGSIGSETLRALLKYHPASVDVIDHNENGLAELIRDLRGSSAVAPSTALRLSPIDCASPITRRYLREFGPFDVVLHFAALKHVRSEKDPIALLQMFSTNVLAQWKLLRWLAEHGWGPRYFAVSTDKAARPVSFMGASKRIMELALLSAGTRFGFHVTSARFANVAFSAGSLLHSWHDRLRLRQPIPAPRETWRYFVSGEEAAHICLLATSILPTGSIAIPVFSPESDSRLLDSVAAGFIRNAGYRPKVYHSETTAKAAITSDIAAGEWPLLLTPRDTQGEKEKEVFLAETESALATTCDSLLRIPSAAPPEALDSVLRQLELWVTGDDGRVSRSSVAQVVQRVVPEFRPSTADQRLDDRL